MAYLNYDSKTLDEETNRHSSVMACNSLKDSKEGAAEPSCDNKQEIEIISESVLQEISHQPVAELVPKGPS